MQKTIVYIEDDDDDIMILRESLSRIEGAPLLNVFKDPKEAVAYLGQNTINPQYCYVLVDLNLGFSYGTDVVKKIQATAKLDEVEIAFFTTSSKKIDQEAAEALGIKYMIKPDNIDDIVAMMKEVVAYCQNKAQEDRG